LAQNVAAGSSTDRAVDPPPRSSAMKGVTMAVSSRVVWVRNGSAIVLGCLPSRPSTGIASALLAVLCSVFRTSYVDQAR
jgi:hypothetical protein